MRWRPFTRVLLCISSSATILLAISPAIAQPSFMPLGDLPGGTFGSFAYGVSADGSVVVGWSYSANGEEAFRWTQATGMVGLGDLTGGITESQARAVSADGAVVVGYSISAAGPEAFRWTLTSGMVGLGSLGTGASGSEARGVSSDGRTIVGLSHGAFRWTMEEGMRSLGVADARGVSSDGSVIVGARISGSATEAFRWVDGSAEGLGFLPGGQNSSQANAVTPDGHVIIGVAQQGSTTQAFRWTRTSGMVGLGTYPGGDPYSGARSVSADGRIVVGDAQRASRSSAFVWVSTFGMLELKAYLLSLGVSEVAGWELGEATAISADGTTIVGSGMGPNGWECWLARIPCNQNLIATHPADQHVSPSATVTFSVAATESSASFAWRKNGTPLSDTSRITGSASQNLLIASTQSTDQGVYDCVVTGTCGSTTSNAAALSCKAVVTNQPRGGAFFAGQQVVLSAAHVQAGAVTYRWKRDGSNVFNSPIYSGATTPILTISTTDPSQSGAYTLSITNLCGVTTTMPANVEVVCGADFNADGGVDGDDVNAFFASWEHGDSSADVSLDGGVDGADVSEFFEHWEAGC